MVFDVVDMECMMYKGNGVIALYTLVLVDHIDSDYPGTTALGMNNEIYVMPEFIAGIYEHYGQYMVMKGN